MRRITVETVKQAWRSRRTRYGIICIAIVVIGAGIFLVNTPKGTERNWTKAEKGTFYIEIVESGEVRAVNAEFVRAPREWRMDLQIIDIAAEGTMVEKGDFLVQFDTSVLDEELTAEYEALTQAEKDLLSIDTKQASRKSEMLTNLEISGHSLEAAKLNVEMMRYESRAKQEEAELDLKTEEIRYGEALNNIETQKIIDATERQKVENRLEHAKLDVERIKRRIERLTLRAPISGMVVYQEVGGRGPDNPRYKVTIGDNVQSGEAIIGIPDLSKMKLVVKVNEIDADKIVPGQQVFIRLDAFEEELYHGTVSDIANLIEKSERFWEAQSKVPSFDVNIHIDETSMLLKPGMTAQARIIIDEIPNATIVPIGAVYELDNGETVVYPRKRYPKPVKITMIQRNDRFAVIESELKEDEVITWSPPSSQAHPLGWFSEMERRRTEFQNLLAHIDTMEERGITYTPSKKDSVSQDRAQSAAEKNISASTPESVN